MVRFVVVIAIASFGFGILCGKAAPDGWSAWLFAASVAACISLGPLWELVRAMIQEGRR